MVAAVNPQWPQIFKLRLRALLLDADAVVALRWPEWSEGPLAYFAVPDGLCRVIAETLLERRLQEGFNAWLSRVCRQTQLDHGIRTTWTDFPRRLLPDFQARLNAELWEWRNHFIPGWPARVVQRRLKGKEMLVALDGFHQQFKHEIWLAKQRGED